MGISSFNPYNPKTQRLFCPQGRNESAKRSWGLGEVGVLPPEVTEASLCETRLPDVSALWWMYPVYSSSFNRVTRETDFVWPVSSRSVPLNSVLAALGPVLCPGHSPLCRLFICWQHQCLALQAAQLCPPLSRLSECFGLESKPGGEDSLPAIPDYH